VWSNFTRPGATDSGLFPNPCPDSPGALMKFDTLFALGTDLAGYDDLVENWGLREGELQTTNPMHSGLDDRKRSQQTGFIV
jgi:hypothetical protein